MQSVNIRNFDAQGDGTTDDWAAMQAAVNALAGIEGVIDKARMAEAR